VLFAEGKARPKGKGKYIEKKSSQLKVWFEHVF
jgi:hypothetical protein